MSATEPRIREQFEKWIKSIRPNCRLDREGGEYKWLGVEDDWEAWQAASAAQSAELRRLRISQLRRMRQRVFEVWSRWVEIAKYGGEDEPKAWCRKHYPSMGRFHNAICAEIERLRGEG